MTRQLRIAGLSFALAIAAMPLSAQIAPDALWDRWQSATGAITAIEGTARRDGGGLRVENARLRLGRGEAAPVVIAGTLRLLREGEATRVVMPDTWQIDIDGVAVSLDAPEAELTARGEIGDPAYSFAAPSILASTEAFPLDTGTKPATLALTELTATYSADGGSVAAATLDAEIGAEGDPQHIVVSQGETSITLDGAVEILAAATLSDTLPDAPFSIAVRAKGVTTRVTSADRSGDPLTVTVVSELNDLRVGSDTDRARVEQSFSGASLSLAGQGIPLTDAAVSIGAATLRLDGPAAPGPDPAPFSLDVAVEGIGASEQVWQLIDPAGALGRDPASLRLAISGQTLLLPPGEDGVQPQPTPERMALETLRIEALGARLDASGSVLFREAPGPERPLGAPVGLATATLTDAIALLDRIDALGTLPSGLMMGARMGLGFMTTPGNEPNELVTQIEIGADGMVVMNGQQIYRLP